MFWFASLLASRPVWMGTESHSQRLVGFAAVAGGELELRGAARDEAWHVLHREAGAVVVRVGVAGAETRRRVRVRGVLHPALQRHVPVVTGIQRYMQKFSGREVKKDLHEVEYYGHFTPDTKRQHENASWR